MRASKWGIASLYAVLIAVALPGAEGPPVLTIGIGRYPLEQREMLTTAESLFPGLRAEMDFLIPIQVNLFDSSTGLRTGRLLFDDAVFGYFTSAEIPQLLVLYGYRDEGDPARDFDCGSAILEPVLDAKPQTLVFRRVVSQDSMKGIGSDLLCGEVLDLGIVDSPASKQRGIQVVLLERQEVEGEARGVASRVRVYAVDFSGARPQRVGEERVGDGGGPLRRFKPYIETRGSDPPAVRRALDEGETREAVRRLEEYIAALEKSYPLTSVERHRENMYGIRGPGLPSDTAETLCGRLPRAPGIKVYSCTIVVEGKSVFMTAWVGTSPAK